MSNFTSGGNLSFLNDQPIASDELAWDHAMDISGSVYARLNELGMSSKDLAGKLGVTPGRVSQILKGYPGMSLKMLAKLEAALDFRLDGGFVYVPEEGGASATAEAPRLFGGGSAWTDRPLLKEDGGTAPLFRAVRGGLFAA